MLVQLKLHQICNVKKIKILLAERNICSYQMKFSKQSVNEYQLVAIL